MPGPTVHHRLTKTWAVEEGMDAEDAAAVAEADILVDAIWPGSRMWARHFNPTATLLCAPVYMRLALRRARALQRWTARAALAGSPVPDSTAARAVAAIRADALVLLGRSLHSRQDGLGHGVFGLAHVRYRFGLLKRHPDVWETMPPSLRASIERATRRTLKRFIAAAGPSA